MNPMPGDPASYVNDKFYSAAMPKRVWCVDQVKLEPETCLDCRGAGGWAESMPVRKGSRKRKWLRVQCERCSGTGREHAA